jgi:hypothetical protein
LSRLRLLVRSALCLGALAAITAAAPALANARTITFGHQHVKVATHRDHRWWGHSRTYGATTLTLDPAAASALQSLGVTPAPIAPATAGAAGLRFPITDSLLQTALTGTITHSGGISLTAGSTTVSLTDFWIKLGAAPTLSADVGGTRVTILDLSLTGARARLADGRLRLGPVTATLTPAAADALNAAFGVTAFTPGLTLGTATIHYRLF